MPFGLQKHKKHQPLILDGYKENIDTLTEIC